MQEIESEENSIKMKEGKAQKKRQAIRENVKAFVGIDITEEEIDDYINKPDVYPFLEDYAIHLKEKREHEHIQKGSEERVSSV